MNNPLKVLQNSNVYAILLLLSISILPTNCNLTREWCCELGKRNSKSSRLCVDYTSISAYSPNDTCKYYFTICCNQNNRNEECERAKAFAYQQESCFDSRRHSSITVGTSTYDTFSECCNCCHLGIEMSKQSDECKSSDLLPTNCNQILLDCCSASKVVYKSQTPIRRDESNQLSDCSNKCHGMQICRETPDGPICACPNGYEMDRQTNECKDINECEQRNACSLGSNCTNTVGSFICSRICSIGFVFDATVGQCRDVNECLMNIHKCSKGMRCENIPGAYRCIRETPCGTGYSIDSYTQECVDIDECASKIDGCPVGYECQNIIGSFKCKPRDCGKGEIFNYNTGVCEQLLCMSGYTVHNSSGECIDINECDIDPNICQLSENCENLPGSHRCIPKVSCERGYESTAKDGCVDIDECATRRHTCPSTASCVNKIGSYTCVCPPGYTLDVTGTRCDDVDECSLGYECPRNSKCVNTIGSYDCKCNTGFQIFEDKSYKFCKDIDECQTPYLCQHKCFNTYGSYQCLCNEGFKLASDKRTCIDIDECQLHKNICMGPCTNTIGSFECNCADGFELDKTYKRTCYDVDECATNRHTCNSQERCLNTRGSYKCMRINCPPGYYLAGGYQSTRCDRASSICRNDDYECLRKPMKIFHHYITFTYKIVVPVKIFTPPTIFLPPTGHHTIKYELKLISTNGTNSLSALTSSDFSIRYLGATSVEVILQRSPMEVQEANLELTAEIYSNRQYQTSLLNKIYMFITE